MPLTSIRTASMGQAHQYLTLGMAQPTRSTAISSRASTDSMASAGKASPRPPVGNSSDYIRSAGSVSSRKHLRSAMNACMPVTNEVSHDARCAPKREAAIMFQCSIDDHVDQARRAILGRTQTEARRRGGGGSGDRTLDREEHRVAALLCPGADAVRQSVSGGGCRAYRAPDRRQRL